MIGILIDVHCSSNQVLKKPKYNKNLNNVSFFKEAKHNIPL